MRKAITLSIVFSMATLLFCHIPATATILVENDNPISDLLASTYIGQSLTTPAGPGWNNLLFSWLKDGASVWLRRNTHKKTLQKVIRFKALRIIQGQDRGPALCRAFNSL